MPGLTPIDMGDILEQIQTIRAQLVPSIKNLFSDFENLVTLDSLENYIKSSQAGEFDDLIKWKRFFADRYQGLKQLLGERWHRIRNSSMCYTQSPFNPVNLLCLQIAKMVFPIPEKGDFTPRKGPYYILMPSLMASEQNIHDLALHQFVLADGERCIISLADYLNYTRHMNSAKDLSTESVTQQYARLTSAELRCITNHSKVLNDYYNAIVAYKTFQLEADDLSINLGRLIRELSAGSCDRGGWSLQRRTGWTDDAGQSAYTGIVDFYLYWEGLSKQRRRQYQTFFPELEQTIAQLMRSAGGYEATPSVETIVSKLESIIAKYCLIPHQNEEELLANIEQKKQVFLAENNSANYQMNQPQKTTAPKVLALLYQLPKEQQQAIFYSQCGLEDAWMFALAIEPAQVPDFLPLNPTAIQQAIDARFESTLMTPLIVAVYQGCVSAINVLIDVIGVDVNDCDKHLNTALHWAAMQGQRDALMALVTKNANTTLKNSEGLTAMDIVSQKYPELLSCFSHVPLSQAASAWDGDQEISCYQHRGP